MQRCIRRESAGSFQHVANKLGVEILSEISVNVKIPENGGICTVHIGIIALKRILRGSAPSVHLLSAVPMLHVIDMA